MWARAPPLVPPRARADGSVFAPGARRRDGAHSDNPKCSRISRGPRFTGIFSRPHVTPERDSNVSVAKRGICFSSRAGSTDDCRAFRVCPTLLRASLHRSRSARDSCIAGSVPSFAPGVPAFIATTPGSSAYFLGSEKIVPLAAMPSFPDVAGMFSFPAVPGMQSIPGVPGVLSSPPNNFHSLPEPLSTPAVPGFVVPSGVEKSPATAAPPLSPVIRVSSRRGAGHGGFGAPVRSHISSGAISRSCRSA